MPLSNNPQARERQLQNLARGPLSDPDAEARRKRGLKRGGEVHGAYASQRRQPLELMHRDRLHDAFPAAREAVGGDDAINVAARLAALCDLYGAHVDDCGVLVRRGKVQDVAPAARELRLALTNYAQAVEQLRALEREHDRGDALGLDAYVRKVAEQG